MLSFDLEVPSAFKFWFATLCTFEGSCLSLGSGMGEWGQKSVHC